MKILKNILFLLLTPVIIYYFFEFFTYIFFWALGLKSIWWYIVVLGFGTFIILYFASFVHHFMRFYSGILSSNYKFSRTVIIVFGVLIVFLYLYSIWSNITWQTKGYKIYTSTVKEIVISIIYTISIVWIFLAFISGNERAFENEDTKKWFL